MSGVEVGINSLQIFEGPKDLGAPHDRSKKEIAYETVEPIFPGFEVVVRQDTGERKYHVKFGNEDYGDTPRHSYHDDIAHVIRHYRRVIRNYWGTEAKTKGRGVYVGGELERLSGLSQDITRISGRILSSYSPEDASDISRDIGKLMPKLKRARSPLNKQAKRHLEQALEQEEGPLQLN